MLRHPQCGGVDTKTTRHDQGHAAFGTLGIKSRQPLKPPRQIFQPCVHRTHQNPVFQGQRTDLQRGQQVRVDAQIRGHEGLVI